jgi:regulator of PEP synthase PpsR (kinase-PPPase family)
MAQRTDSYFHLHLVSDATGETLTTVARAATAQYAKVVPVEHVYLWSNGLRIIAASWAYRACPFSARC